MAGKTGRVELEAFAAAFMAGTASPDAPDRLREYGLQRVLARASAAEAHKAPSSARRAYRSPAMLRHALIAAMAVLLVMVLSTSGVYAFSLDAQPGSTLYGAKIFFERARVTLNTSSAGDIRLEMGFSERRIRELQEMAASGDHGGAERWLREYGRNIEGAGVLFEGMTDQEVEQLAAEFQAVLDRQAQIIQGMRQGLQPGLSGPVDSAYRMCDQERARMRRRCGQQETGEPEQAPGGQGQQGQGGHGEGGCPGTGDTSTPGETSSSTEITPLEYGEGSVEAGPSNDTTGETHGGPTDESTGPSTDAPQSQGPSGDAGGQAARGEGSQGDGAHTGCMP
ncbi:MAG: DUF5667 domain-containing protein [Actinomycetota bacterium]